MTTCDKCKDGQKEAQFTSLAIVTSDKNHDLESFEYEADLCFDCRAKQRTAIELALGITLVDVSPSLS